MKFSGWPYGKKVMVAVLASVFASGGYGGYVVSKEYKKYGVGFDERYHTVTQVVDGDTIRLDDEFVVRLLGINAPERGQCYEDEATNRLRALVLDQEVYLDKDMEAVDDSGRLLRYVFLRDDDPTKGDTMVNYEMVTGGFATSYWIAPNRRYHGLFTAGQDKARTLLKGVWGDCEQEMNVLIPERQRSVMQPSPECSIKGNVSEKEFGQLYYEVGCANYGRVKIDPDRGEAWFCSREEAEASGFNRSGSCPAEVGEYG
jgi:micrococcal nuclease